MGKLLYIGPSTFRSPWVNVIHQAYPSIQQYYTHVSFISSLSLIDLDNGILESRLTE